MRKMTTKNCNDSIHIETTLYAEREHAAVVGNTVNVLASAHIQTNQILTFPFKWPYEAERRKTDE